jgi:mono/diheme cytochrome c family protein
MTRITLILLPVTLVVTLVSAAGGRRSLAAAEPVAPAAAGSAPAGKLEYNRDIRPILAENCFACHGPDSAARKAGLRLDRRDAAVEAQAIVPGRPDRSEMVRRIFAPDGEGQMPPARSHKKLTAAQKETLKRWVAEGAEYQPHWSFIPPSRPPVPEVKNKSWVRNPIDNFILARLERVGLTPAPEADRRTLARRLALDLTGLPPDPADVEALVADRSEAWYEKYVDKLLASPHWGEHRGRYWLDYARYADTHGIHFDNYREIWAYRDWVINAFNRNQPFDQFTIEQLAGDLLPNPTLDQRVATGFNRCNITTNEGGVIPEEYIVLYARDRTETTATVWMGLTAGCAVCHDHKYDPISMRDFYSLSAFFNNTTQNAMDGNVPNTPPVIPVPRPEDRPRYEQLVKELESLAPRLQARKAAARPDFENWLRTARPEAFVTKAPTDGLAFHAPLAEGEGRKLTVTVAGKERVLTPREGFDWTLSRDGRPAFTVKAGFSPELADVGDFDRDSPFSVSAWVWLPQGNTAGAVLARMDSGNAFRGWDLWLEGGRIGVHLISSWPNDALKVVARQPLAPGRWHHVTAVYDGTGKAAAVRLYVNGELQPADAQVDTLKSTTRTKVPFKIGQRHSDSRVNGVGIADVRIYSRKLDDQEVSLLGKAHRSAELLAKPADKRTPQETEELFAWWVATHDAAYQELSGRLNALQAEEAAIKARGTVAHVMQERPGEPMAYILFRGEYDKRRDPVKADTPAALPPLPKDLPRNRLGLAKWLLHKDHPLTARVTVNRFWQEVFGTGLVRTSGDFGVAGELPSHPELLDWLAVEFREPTPGLCCDDPRPWDVKRFFKLIVTSATYRQSAVATKEKLEKDADNRLLSRGPRFRMDAEMIRDHALAASGLLVRKIGGPSVKPYQPDGVWEAVAMIGSNTRDYRRDSGENLYRRSLYTFWKRSAPPAAMEVLNAPNRETCTVRRDRTNTPIAALLTLNDVQFVEAARVLAEKALKAAPDDDARIGFVSARLITRPFRPQELAIVKQSLADLRQHYRAKPDEARKLIAFGESKADPALDPSELAAWTMLVNELFNLDEVLNK